MSSRSDRLARGSQRPVSSYDKAVSTQPHYGSGIPVQCQFCAGQDFRRSRLRTADFRDIFLMRYPVRCLRCSQRQTVSFTIAGISVPSHIRQRKASRDLKFQKNWSDPELKPTQSPAPASSDHQED